MSQFSTNESISLEKRIEIKSNRTKTPPENINNIYELDSCAKWILENDYKRVCLQFPDYLIHDSADVVENLEKRIQRKVYILGDTAYESCCIDYTAAKHISADGVIHFGPTCFSKTEIVIPYLRIYEKFDINVADFCHKATEKFTDNQRKILVVVDTPFLHKIDDIRKELNENHFNLQSIEDIVDIKNETVLYLGENDKKLMNINLTFNPKNLYYFDPKVSKDICIYEQDMKILKRRYFLTEKIKDSNTIGIVISTLAVRNYLKIIERLKTLIKVHEKKYYILSVGKPNVAKLANFPEIDIFVVVGCAMNEIYENRDFYKPIVTPFDLEASLNSKLQTSDFSYDFNKFLHENSDKIEANFDQSDVSLLTGQIRYHHQEKTIENTEETNEKQIAMRQEGKLQVCETFGAGFLSNRSWKGLEQDLGKDDPQLAVKGRKGIAKGYQNEVE